MINRRNSCRLGIVASASVGLAWALAACASAPGLPTLAEAPAIVFVHGNGDSAALWQTTLWRFESNGWPRSRLHAIDVPYPLARDEDAKVQAGRTSSAENRDYLKAEVAKVLKATGASQVVLFANSRGGNAVRDYIANAGGDKLVSHAILGGTPNHGVWAIKGFREANEFSGTGPFLSALNAPKNAAGDEVTPGPKWMTIRSENNDKFAQPDGLWIGAKGTPTNVSFAGPELKGAQNVVIPKIDHRETSYSPLAFDAAYRFITGKAPKTTAIEPEANLMLDGQITGMGVKSEDPGSGNFVNNLPIVQAKLEVFAIDSVAGTRKGAAVHSKVVGADGRYGPFAAKAGERYEFVVTAAGYATTHFYRSAFPRSSSIVHLRPERIAEAEKDAKSIAIFTRPRGYFDASRDQMSFDGQTPPPGLPPAGAGLAVSKIKYSLPTARSVSASFNGEMVVGQLWSREENHVTILELHQ